MDSLHLHLVLNHFPIVGTIIGFFILGYGMFLKNDSIKKTALGIFVVMAVITIPVYLTGEGAEESIEHLAGISEQIIENHEELAELAILFMGILGVISFLNLFAIYRKASFVRTMTLISLVMSLITLGVFVKVGSLGGQIRHSEIRNNNETQTINKVDIKTFNNKKEHDDDD